MGHHLPEGIATFISLYYDLEFGLLVETASEAFIDSFIGALFGVTGGIMLYIAFVELLPTAIITAKKYSLVKGDAKYKQIYMVTLVAIFAGFLVMDISNILLAESGGHSH